MFFVIPVFAKEGITVEIGDRTPISLSMGELDAIIHLKNALDYERDKFKN